MKPPLLLAALVGDFEIIRTLVPCRQFAGPRYRKYSHTMLTSVGDGDTQTGNQAGLGKHPHPRGSEGVNEI